MSYGWSLAISLTSCAILVSIIIIGFSILFFLFVLIFSAFIYLFLFAQSRWKYTLRRWFVDVKTNTNILPTPDSQKQLSDTPLLLFSSLNYDSTYSDLIYILHSWSIFFIHLGQDESQIFLTLFFNGVYNTAPGGEAGVQILTRRPLNRHFFIVNSPLIFVCAIFYTKQISEPTFFNGALTNYLCMRNNTFCAQKDSVYFSTNFFNSAGTLLSFCTLYTKQLSLPLTQHSIMAYKTPFFVCVILHFVRETTKYTHQPTFFNSATTTYFCIRGCTRYCHCTSLL